MDLYFAAGCPFAQRTRALLTRLDHPFEPHVVNLASRPPEFLAVSPNGKVPLLVDGTVKLYESFIVNLYLAEKLDWAQAFASDVGIRARQRLAMLQFDEVVIPAYYKSLREPLEADRLDALKKALAEMERTVELTEGADNLLGIHCATHWARWRWMPEDSSVMALVEEYASLTEWLDDVAALAHVKATLPDREAFVPMFRARFGKK